MGFYAAMRVVPGTRSPRFSYPLISARNSSHKAGDDGPEDRGEKQSEAGAAEGEYPSPELEHTETFTAMYQQLIIAG
jgi:hypothetical protein